MVSVARAHRIMQMIIGNVRSLPLKDAPTASTCGYDFCPAVNPDMTNVHLVCHTHDDVGWLKTPDEYYYGDKNNIQKAGVQYILDTVIDELLKDPQRRFIYVETSFFYRWWTSRDESVHEKVNQLVQSGQLEFIGGGWCMNDEAGNYYADTIDQMTWGFRFLNDTFGPCGAPRVAWQIDPFGHSREQASLFAQMGFDGLFFARLDYQDKDQRKQDKTMELIWQGSANLGAESQLFTGALYNHYSAPSGFNFEVTSNDEPIKDNPMLKGYNVDSRVDAFLNVINDQKQYYTTNNIMITMGDDFQYQDAVTWYTNLDKLIKYVNARQANGSNINVFYSTPSCYVKAVNDAGKTYSVKTDDFFPYASDDHAYWTGYFTSRPALKGYAKVGNDILQIAKQVSAFASLDSSNEDKLAVLKRFQGDIQHHDAISGTSKQAVAYDYAQSLAMGVSQCQASINDAYSRLLPIGSVSLPEQQFCTYLNVSYCDATENQNSFVLTVFNPLGHNLKSHVRVPVTGTYSVTGPDGSAVDSQIVNIPQQVMDNPEKLGTASVELVFNVNLPPLGMNSYFVQATLDNEVKHQKVQNMAINIQADDLVIQNEFLSVAVDGSTGLLKSITDLSTSKIYNVKQDFYYYIAMAGDNHDADHRASGAYVFRPNGTDVYPVGSNVTATIISGTVVQEIQQTFSSYVSQVIRLYPGATAVELEWLVGPIPIDDRNGKEIISRFETDFTTDGVFYTDSNGREILERKRDFRPTWNVQIAEPIAGNYYPVNSRIYIQDSIQDSQFTVVTDRSQGGSSILDGTVELMVHRRLLHDDAFGVGEALNEPGVDGHGLRVRGKHFLLVSSIEAAAPPHRIAGLVASYPPLVSIAQLISTVEDWQQNYKTTYSALQTALPDNVNLVTVEPWSNGNVLIRLEHFLEANDDPDGLSQPVTINLQNIFSAFQIVQAYETTLGANVWLQDKSRLSWNTNVTSSRAIYINNAVLSDPFDVTLEPMQIKTFVVQATYG